MEKALVTTCALIALVATPPGVAANYGVPGPAPETTVTQMMPGQDGEQLSQQDRNFVEAIAMGGMTELETGKLAGKKARNKDVRKFGEHMVKDHRAGNTNLESLAKRLNVELPKEPDADHKTMMERLSQADKKNFDTLYIDGQVQDHQHMVNLIEMEIGSGQNEELKKFASDMLPAVQEHLKMANQLADKLRM